MIGLDRIREESLYPRELLSKLEPWLARREAIVIVGPRRVGKTSLLKLLALRLAEEGKPVFFFDLEDPDDRDVIEAGPGALRKFLGRPGVVFLDEFHLLEDPARFVKLTVDHFPELKLILTGSSSLAVLKHFRDSLIGRLVEFELFSLSFREFLHFREEDSYARWLEPVSIRQLRAPEPLRIPGKIWELLEEFLLFGGFPEVVLARDPEVKSKLLSQIFRLYALRDLRLLFAQPDPRTFERVFLALSGSVGSIVKFSEMASDIGVNHKTVKHYLELLKALFLVKEVPPLAENPRTELKKACKVYFADTGLLSWALGNFSPLALRPQAAGLYAENMVALALLRNLRPEERLRFWRKKSGPEVDFVVLTSGEYLPVETKFRGRPEKLSGLKSFIKRYRPLRAVVVSRDRWEEKSLNGTKVHFLPLVLFEG
ncbi:ATP-binding protein [Thermosulfurimonas sp. F29]|uniref:ATP-binding protein n=1 Tax=Thermosulfurimonas sp. F29 TaxID=2867247 RepID=UPI001C837062|nr:ATP-binding protein [Thermosulfurimonas sp. F29]MBX6423416.1 ATP-binding protein [Thermosulfurimonas sp. F29]